MIFRFAKYISGTISGILFRQKVQYILGSWNRTNISACTFTVHFAHKYFFLRVKRSRALLGIILCKVRLVWSLRDHQYSGLSDKYFVLRVKRSRVSLGIILCNVRLVWSVRGQQFSGKADSKCGWEGCILSSTWLKHVAEHAVGI